MERVVREWYTDSVSSSPDYCRIVSDRHQARLKSLLSSSKGKIAFGGVTEDSDKLITPTVVTDVKLDDSLMKVMCYIAIVISRGSRLDTVKYKCSTFLFRMRYSVPSCP